MEKSLLLIIMTVSISSLFCSSDLSGQSVVFSEDFSGFATCTHSSPSPYDQSSSLDSKTSEPGWTGSKVYSAGGEIKLGTADVPGWIETPSIDLTGYEGIPLLKFDISRWPDDATTVQVSLNGSPLGDPFSPTDEFQTVDLPLTDAGSTARIKFESLSKRFFLDNVLITAQNVTYITKVDQQHLQIQIYPNPACDIIHLENIFGYNRLDIRDMAGRIIKSAILDGRNKLEFSLTGIPPGIYLIIFISDTGCYSSRLIKYHQVIR
jgi:hypothetical protein